jgi:hypothetical protein
MAKKISMRPDLPAGMPTDPKLSGDGRMIVCEDAIMATAGARISTPLIFPKEKFDAWRRDRKLPPKSLARAKGSIREEWVEAILQNKPEMASASFDYSALLTESALLGNLAIRSGSGLGWDPAKMQATGNDTANKFVTPVVREGWFSETFDVI